MGEAGMEAVFFHSAVRGILGPQKPNVFHLHVHTLPPFPSSFIWAVKSCVAAVDVGLVLRPLGKFPDGVLEGEISVRGAGQTWRQAVWVRLFQDFCDDAGRNIVSKGGVTQRY